MLQNSDGSFSYNYYNVDSIYDYLLSIGVRPLVELSFMPGYLAQCGPWAPHKKFTYPPICPTQMHYRGIKTPPKNGPNATTYNWTLWGDLIEDFATHLVGRYGIDEVSTWIFEVWNEQMGMGYSEGLYLPLYDAAYDALRRVSPRLHVGGPVSKRCELLTDFVRDEAGRFDFVSTHLYPTDGNCTAGGAKAHSPHCFSDTVIKARAAVPKDTPFYLTEYNAGLDNSELLYSSYAAGFVFDNIPRLAGLGVDIWSYWTFSDVFEESGMHAAPFSGFNYGIQTIRGVPKPVYRAFQLLRSASTSQLPVKINGGGRVNAFATAADVLTASPMQIFISNFVVEGWNITSSSVDVVVEGMFQAACESSIANEWTRLDSTHGNPHAAWAAMGRPSYPTAVQIETLRAVSEIVWERISGTWSSSTRNSNDRGSSSGNGGRCAFELPAKLEAHSVAVLRLH